jgi:type II secretory pathway pseudopilin PulG
MNAQKHTGFTIIEVTLVLAISSLMLLLMMTGITLAVQRQRFSDSVNGTQSYLQQQFNYTQNVINNRSVLSCDPNSPGDTLAADPSVRGASGCLIIGKLIEIRTGGDESTVATYDVIGKDVDAAIPPYDAYSDLQLIRAISPTAIKQSTPDSSYNVPWGAQISALKDADSAGGNDSPTPFIALLRSPRSGVIHIYKIAINQADFTDPSQTKRQLSANIGDLNIQEVANDSIKMCLSSADLADYGAMLEIIPSGSQDGIVAHFDDAAKESYPCS